MIFVRFKLRLRFQTNREGSIDIINNNEILDHSVTMGFYKQNVT